MDKSRKEKINLIRKMIVILALAIVVSVIVIIILLNNPVDNRLRYIYNENKEGNIEISPLNVSPLFVDYVGRVNQRSLYKAMYVFVNDIVQDYYLKFKENNFDKEVIATYYNEHSEDIKRELRIENQEEFITLMNTIKDLKGDELILKSYTIVPDSISKERNGTEFVLLVEYEGNESVGFYLKILNTSTSDNSPIEYRGGVDNSEYLEYEYEINDGPQMVIENPPGKVVN